ncbi:nucleotidyltransferase family protein [Shewanella submarina]|uniref:N-acetylmuramate alpha-1-phosphate uridylyltransferase MurU n=1 Tax=Shewanella submarina TaxID=2016376 RepID=A0ABV7G714_9GAMM|nr:nucleotidyltransferase family protein [Shewanella submarina]MCL1037312.1 nucleotidyltransferase family protein [Shewanella submarina]
MRAMILAAGRGERLRPLTDTCPKPLVKACGKPLIEYHLENLARAGFSTVVINHAWLGHMLEETLGDGSSWGLKIIYSPEGTALETGGGIKQALPLLSPNGQDPFLVINGDIFIDDLPSDLVLPTGKLAHLFLVSNPENHPNGDFVLEQGLVSEDEDKPRLTFAGMGVYHPALFDDSPQGAFGTPLLLRKQMPLQKISGTHFQGYWLDVGTLERLKGLEARLTHI